ncbi:MAG: hypothetical protein JNK79_14255 [Chitinophagaceae bacterium]|nr:hypothetical protein [Chitinophagaceae bacterium]
MLCKIEIPLKPLLSFPDEINYVINSNYAFRDGTLLLLYGMPQGINY